MHTDMNAYTPETPGAEYPSQPQSHPHPEPHPDAATAGDDVEARALDLANQAIAHQASGESDEAARHWREAIALADHGLPGDSLRYWLRSGLAEACFRLGDDAACIAAAAWLIVNTVKVSVDFTELPADTRHLGCKRLGGKAGLQVL